ncbi:MAG: NADH-quinone oxidoreductase subunit C [Anaerolineales bacterium]|nr:NADH-quinone oxidoreductase subunit C [Anaerolineales bacterium]HEY62059.1 NADH-quinone oxidoreductase subunit C [Anaerolineae bacterium]
MSEQIQMIAKAFQERFNAEMQAFRGDVELIVSRDYIVEAAKTLRDVYGFEMLTAITAVDYFPNEDPRFHVLYMFFSYSKNIRLRIRVPVPGLKPVIPTIEKIFPNANWYEREVWDLFGINVEGSHDLRRLIMPQDWEGHPLRKDYPLGYEEVQFTFNYDEINLHKIFPKE